MRASPPVRQRQSSSFATKVFWFLLVTALVGVVYVALGPMRLMKRFGEAVAARDSAGIEACVDFPKLRASVKSEVSRKLSSGSKAIFADNPLASLAAGLASNLTDPLVDQALSPQGLERMLAGERLLDALRAEPGTGTAERAVVVPQAFSSASYGFRGLREFSVTLTPRPNLKVELLLEREWLSWKIVGVKLPE